MHHPQGASRSPSSDGHLVCRVNKSLRIKVLISMHPEVVHLLQFSATLSPLETFELAVGVCDDTLSVSLQSPGVTARPSPVSVVRAAAIVWPVTLGTVTGGPPEMTMSTT